MLTPKDDLILAQHNLLLVEARRRQALAVVATVGAAFGWVTRSVRAVVGSIAHAIHQARQLSELSRLSDRQLADIGISRADIPRIVAGEPIGRYELDVPGLKGWTPSKASNDWQAAA